QLDPVDVQDEVALFTNSDAAHSAELEVDGARIAAGADDEVVFKRLPIGAVKEHVHAGQNAVVTNAGVALDVRFPLRGIRSDEIIASAGQFVDAGRRAAAAADDPGGDRAQRPVAQQRQHRAVVTQIEPVTAPASNVPNLALELTVV